MFTRHRISVSDLFSGDIGYRLSRALAVEVVLSGVGRGRWHGLGLKILLHIVCSWPVSRTASVSMCSVVDVHCLLRSARHVFLTDLFKCGKHIVLLYTGISIRIDNGQFGDIQSNFKGSNTCGTMKISSRQG